MDYISAIIFGIIQGITEFVPVSSSGHLVILHELIALPLKNEVAFDVALHLATLLAVLYFFRTEVWLLLASWFRSFSGIKDDYSRISWLIIMGTIPAAIAGWYSDDLIETKLRSPYVVIVMLVLVGILFIISEKISKKIISYNNIGWRQAVLIGFAQAIALIPGTSRSGITIIAGLTTGLQREAAIKFSFLLSIPIIAGASLKKIPPIIEDGIGGDELTVIIIAFIFSFLAAILAIKYFMRFARKHSLNIFAYYRFILAAVLAVYFLV